MLVYRKGAQAEKLDDLPLSKVNLVRKGETEGIWVKQGPDYVVLQNNALHFYPFFSWGTVFPSKNPPGENREVIDVSHLEPVDGLELHPDAWEQHFEAGRIDADGNFVPDEDEEEGD